MYQANPGKTGTTMQRVHPHRTFSDNAAYWRRSPLSTLDKALLSMQLLDIVSRSRRQTEPSASATQSRRREHKGQQRNAVWRQSLATRHLPHT